MNFRVLLASACGFIAAGLSTEAYAIQPDLARYCARHLPGSTAHSGPSNYRCIAKGRQIVIDMASACRMSGGTGQLRYLSTGGVDCLVPGVASRENHLSSSDIQRFCASHFRAPNVGWDNSMGAHCYAPQVRGQPTKYKIYWAQACQTVYRTSRFKEVGGRTAICIS